MRPRIAITMGDPGGVGPEVIGKALARPDVRRVLQPLVIGDPAVLQQTVAALRMQVDVMEVQGADQVVPEDAVPVLAPSSLPRASAYAMGEVSAANGKAAYACIVTAVEQALSGRVQGICTAPISKEAMFAAGYNFPGHTELLAGLCGNVPVRMMLVGGGVRAVLQTIHVALRQVPDLITAASIEESLRIMNAWGTKKLGRRPRIGVCGLNPHAGEAGHFGREEIETIEPAIARARTCDNDISGPYPADTLFHRMREGEFDMVLAMYHDQALIPVKTLDFHGGVNVTLGLPITRTSPDHGTAFNLAGKGVAREDSMVAALLAAV